MTTALTFEQIEKQITYNNLYTDYKAEVVALNLYKYRQEVDQVLIRRLGNNDRTFNKDIKAVREEYFELGEKIISIDTFREGIYDFLPEGVFHPPSLGHANSNVEEIVHQIRVQRKQEASARKFFYPFELEASYLELNSLLTECDYDLSQENDILIGTLVELWPLLKEFSAADAKVFAYLLPHFHAVRGSRFWFEKCLTAFLQVPVQVTFGPHHNLAGRIATDALVLSQMQLGVSTILTGDHMDGARNWIINYGPLPFEKLNDYVPESPLRRLLETLYGYCLPVSADVEEVFLTENEPEAFRLSEELDTSRLGFSTFV
ncbi:hypothetical protein DBR32_14205 [Taibaiella sp. KBW10]|uniref:hypothetical protein n=1 Tax=Taibaiella sp. KBW10 TaxID=2153357 RepID=UPI000F59C8CF|nr:hypothetical protein [Taibaiella sp. KBW10]RQO29735.1 hypothetical protein DBR32_14205 [Taibaiella sp. KBW10]